MMESDLTELSSLLENYQLRKEDCDKQVSDRHLGEISRTCCKKWRTLPPDLELESIVKDDIDHEPKSEEEKRMIFFTTWKEKKGPHATYRKLIQALLKVECQNDAGKVCELLQKSLKPNPLNRKPSQPTSDAGTTKVKWLCQTPPKCGGKSKPPMLKKENTSSLLELHTDTEPVNLLLDHGTQMDLQDNDGQSAFIAASWKGHTETVKLLLDHGAQVDLQRNNGLSALIAASQKGHTETVKLLLDHGAQMDLQDNDGWSALIVASLHGHTETVKLLLDHGAQVDLQDNNGVSAIVVASIQGHTETVKLLLDHGAQVDLQENTGGSALMIASAQGRTETVKLLLDHGAQFNLRSNNGASALTRASTEGHTETVKLLLDHGAQLTE